MSHLPILPPDPTLTRDAAALQAALSDLVRVSQFRDRDRICCHDISVTQCYALETVIEKGPLTLGALAAELFLDKSTTSRVVATLERKEYLSREPHPEDRRAVLLSATATGRKLCGRIQNDLLRETEALAADLEPAARQGATRLLQRLARAAAERSGLGGSCCDPAGEACSTESC